MNTDHRCVNVNPESEHVSAPRSANRFGCIIKTSSNQRFYLIVAAELNSSMIKDPFMMFQGTKTEDTATATSKLQTNEHTCSHVNFQQNHWFNACLAIRHEK